MRRTRAGTGPPPWRPGRLSAPAAGPHLALLADPGAALRAACAAHDHGACAHPMARQALAAKLRRAEALSGTVLETLASLPQQVIHGDVHPGNVLASRSPGTCGISLIDFDRTRYAPPAYEGDARPALLRQALWVTIGVRGRGRGVPRRVPGRQAAVRPRDRDHGGAFCACARCGPGQRDLFGHPRQGRRCPPPRGRMNSLVVARDRLR